MMEGRTMKNIMKFWALAFCSVVFAVSCEKETEIVGESESIVKAAGTYTIEFPTDPGSKVSLASDGKTAWEAGDQIFIHGQKVGVSGDKYYSRIVTLKAEDISADGKTATFQLDEIVVTEGWRTTGYKANLFAAYPASAVASFADGTSWYYSTAFSTTDVLLLGGTNDSSVNDGNTFTFTNLSGVLSFVVDGDFDSCEFYGNGGSEVIGYDVFAVRVDTESAFGDKNKIPYNGGSGGVGFSGAKTSITASVVADGTTENRIYFPGGVDLASGFTIKFLKGGVEQKRVSTATAKNIACGKYLKLGDITSHLFTYVPPAEHNATSPAIAGAEDLSATAAGPANSYIVYANVPSNAGKVFKFKAVKGNSSANVGAISSVSILWETYNCETDVIANSVVLEADFDKQASNDYYEICFKMPSTLHAGNALIAAKDEGGNILWSWHIWVPETTITTGTYGISTETLMSRNLGALVDTEAVEADVDARSFGLFYQWGRKDPFIGSKRLNSSSQAPCAGTTKSVSATQYTIAQSIANPTTFVGYKGDWMTPEDRTLWTEGGNKSIYDPCPPGYRVPQRNSSDALWSKVTELDPSYGWEPNSTYGWWKLGTAVFPFAGYIDYDGGGVSHAYDRTRIWNAHKSQEAYAYDQQIWYESGAWKSEPGWQHRTACGNSVRCVVE